MAKKRFDIQGLIVDQIVDALDGEIAKAEADPKYKPELPWAKPWVGGYSGMPKSLSSKKPYRGFNVFFLSFLASQNGYSSPYWLTYKQAGKLGGAIKADERKNSAIITFWKMVDIKDDMGEVTYKKWFLRYYRVYNLDQAEGINPDKLPNDFQAKDLENPLSEFTPIESCEKIINEMPNKPTYVIGKIQRASYCSNTDTVNMPEPLSFVGEEEYYSTFLHELAHSTGHSSRLDRDGIKGVAAYGGQSYGQEELVAEISSAILCGIVDISNATLKNSIAYLTSWRQTIKADKGIILRAASRASKAVDYILGDLKPTTK